MYGIDIERMTAIIEDFTDDEEYCLINNFRQLDCLDSVIDDYYDQMKYRENIPVNKLRYYHRTVRQADYLLKEIHHILYAHTKNKIYTSII